MSFSRTTYDESTTALKKQVSTAPYHHIMYNGYKKNDNSCSVERGPRNTVTDLLQTSNAGVKSDIESRLQNRHVPLGPDAENHNEWRDFKNKLKTNSECTNYQTPADEYTRYSHPIDDYRGMSTLENVIVPHLHVNRQNDASTVRPKFVSSRQLAKKTFEEERKKKEAVAAKKPKKDPSPANSEE
jgi:hypothetical protein